MRIANLGRVFRTLAATRHCTGGISRQRSNG